MTVKTKIAILQLVEYLMESVEGYKSVFTDGKGDFTPEYRDNKISACDYVREYLENILVEG